MRDFAYVSAEAHEVPFDSFLQLTKVVLSSSSAFQHNDCSCNLMSSAKLMNVFSMPSSALVKVLNNVVFGIDPWERPPVKRQTIDHHSLSPALPLVFHTLCSPATQFICPWFGYKNPVGYCAESLVRVKVTDTHCLASHFIRKGNQYQAQLPGKALLDESPSCPTSAWSWPS